MYFHIKVQDDTIRTYYNGSDCGIQVTEEYLEISDDTSEQDIDYIIKQYVWSKYGLTINHYNTCRHCDPSVDTPSGRCNLRLSYHKVPITGGKLDVGIKLSDQIINDIHKENRKHLPRNWPENWKNYAPSTMFANGEIGYY